MANLLLLFFCLFLGILLRRFRVLPDNAHVTLTAFVMNISLAALTLFYIPKITLSGDALFPVSVAWFNIILAVLFYGFIGKKFGWSKGLIGAAVMCTGFGNTSFVGLPVIQSLYGEAGTKTVILADQPGTFVALSTIGIALANFYSGQKISAEYILKKMFRFPPFLAFFAAALLLIFQIKLPDTIDVVLEKLGATTVPLALVSVGSQLRFEKPGIYTKPLVIGLIFKLLLFPLAMFTLWFLILGYRGETAEIALLESAMPPMITAAIIASAHGLESKLCNLFVGIGIPLSFLTLALWHYILMMF